MARSFPPEDSGPSTSTGSAPAGPSIPPEGTSAATTPRGEQHKGGYPGQITTSRKTSRTEEGDDEDDSLPEDEPLDLGPLSPRSLYALRNLARYGRRQRSTPMTGSHEDNAPFDRYYPHWPKERRAGVMVALFGGRTGELNVVLSTRALDLRVNPGEVALPGGKVEAGDLSLEHTARREAFEEIGLPMNKEKVRHLCNLPPFLARSAPLLVTPVVCFITDARLKPKLNPREVSNVFSHPLYSFLTETPPSPHYVPHTVYNGTRPYRLQYDIKWLEDSPYRMFRFEGRLNPIWGFTADMLIHVAMLAYKREPDFQRKAPGQLKRRELIEIAQKQLAQGKWPWPIARRQKDKEDSQESTLTVDKQKSRL